MILTDREAPRALREAAREYASQCQWVSDLKKAQERERDKFLAKEDSFLRAAEKRAVLEARLPEQYRTSYLEYCRTLDVGMKRQEQRLAERRAEYKAEQRKIGVKTPTLDTYPLEVPAPRSLRASAESYRRPFCGTFSPGCCLSTAIRASSAAALPANSSGNYKGGEAHDIHVRVHWLNVVDAIDRHDVDLLFQATLAMRAVALARRPCIATADRFDDFVVLLD